MANLVLVAEAAEKSSYSSIHIRHLVRNELVKGRKVGRIWLVDLDDLLRYEQEMDEAGTSKHTPKDKR
ncbi:MAG: hypothetical protein KDE46_00395 [Caldilineaceae bacterium]|nr:hypothetical protein [Caldilineaceae bacterium]